MIFAAGLGTRLRPLTNDKPKALVEINGITMLEMALRKMENAGISRVVVNVHHFRDKMVEFINNYQPQNMEVVVSDESEELLDTGGGLLKAKTLFTPNQPILLYNVDIVTTANLPLFIQFHQKLEPLVSLMVKQRPTSRYLLFDEKMQLAGWQNIKSGEKIICRETEQYKNFGFQGIHIVSPEIFSLITETGKFPIMELYLRLAGSNTFKGYESKDDLWFDIGSPEKLEHTREQLSLLSDKEKRAIY